MGVGQGYADHQKRRYSKQHMSGPRGRENIKYSKNSVFELVRIGK